MPVFKQCLQLTLTTIGPGPAIAKPTSSPGCAVNNFVGGAVIDVYAGDAAIGYTFVNWNFGSISRNSTITFTMPSL
jgi:hypothetical protein